MVNKFCKFAMFMLCMNSVVGCGVKPNNNLTIIEEEDNTSYTEYLLPEDYDFNNAIKDGYVVYSNDGTLSNEEKLELFYNNCLDNIEGNLFIIRYTIEGDAIVSNYVYKNGKYYLYIDNRRDGYSDKDIEIKELKSITIDVDTYGRKMFIQKY